MRNRGRTGTALVTGASSGIGREIARVLAERGYDLVISARRVERLEQLAGELRDRWGAGVTLAPADLSAPEGPDVLMAEVGGHGLALDVLVNCAGTGNPAPFHLTSWEEHQRTIQLMALSPARLIHLLMPGMLERGYGRVVCVCSGAVWVPGLPFHGFYAPTKGFLYKLTQTLAVEYAGSGVTFSATLPGFTESEMLDLSGARHMTDKMPSYMVAPTRQVAVETVDACLSGRVSHTHTWFNRLVFGVMKHAPSRYAHLMMLRERDRLQADLDASSAPAPAVESVRI
jgi:short-subunit dehydrogenase